MKLLRLMLILLAFPAHATVLSDFVDAMAVGTAAKFPSPSFEALPLHRAQFYWGNSGVYLPLSREVVYVGGTGQCCEGPYGYHRRVAYDEVANLWSVGQPIWPSTRTDMGHGFDLNAADPRTSRHYYSRFQQNSVYSDDGFLTWHDLPPVPFSHHADTPAQVWFEKAYGGDGALIYVGDAGELAAYNPDQAGGKWRAISYPTVGTNDNYTATAVGDYVFFGKGNPPSRTAIAQFWRVDSDFNVVRMQDPPITTTVNSVFISSYGQDKLIALDKASRRWWEYEVAADRWTPRVDLDGIYTNSNNRGFIVDLPHLGAVLFVQQYYDKVRTVTILKYRDRLITEVPQPPDPGPDVCTTAGVFICERFDDGLLSHGNLKPGAGGNLPVVSGGHLVMTSPPFAGSDPGGNYALHSLPEIAEAAGAGPLDFIAFSYRIWQDAGAVSLKSPGRKQFILWRGQASCTDTQLVLSHRYQAGIIGTYTSCGVAAMIRVPGPDYRLQWNDYECWYSDVGRRNDASRCVVDAVEEWQDIYFEVRHKEPPYHYTGWIRNAGQDWKMIVDWDVLRYWDAAKFDRFMLTVYQTDRDPGIEYAQGVVRYDDLIMSTQPFRDML